MALINYATREINAKIVYYGPGLSGKTTNIHYVFGKVKQDNKGKLISLATQGDRTLFFDFLPVELGSIKGFKTRFHLYTVPGQVFYNSTRKMVLKGSDGVVFVADSQKMMMEENVQSFENLKSNLRDMGINFDKFPVVMQYNKRDLPNAAPLEDLNTVLNPRGVPYFEASAVKGEGVLKTLTGVVKYVLHDLKETPNTHSLDFAAIEKVADSMVDMPEPVARVAAVSEAPDDLLAERIAVANKKVEELEAASSAADEKSGSESPMPSMPVTDEATLTDDQVELPEYSFETPTLEVDDSEEGLEEDMPVGAVPGLETMDVSAQTELDGQDEVELPEVSPELFGEFEQPEPEKEASTEVHTNEAAEFLEELGGKIAPGSVSDTDLEVLKQDNALTFSNEELTAFSELVADDQKTEQAQEFEADVLQPDDAGETQEIKGDMPAGAGSGLAFVPGGSAPKDSKNVEVSAEASLAMHDEGKAAKPGEPAGIRVKKAFDLPVRINTDKGARDISLRVNLDLELAGMGSATVESVEVLQPVQPKPMQPGEDARKASRPEKDQSKHPPPEPEKKRKPVDITEPVIRIHKKKGMLEKMFGR